MMTLVALLVLLALAPARAQHMVTPEEIDFQSVFLGKDSVDAIVITSREQPLLLFAGANLECEDSLAFHLIDTARVEVPFGQTKMVGVRFAPLRTGMHRCTVVVRFGALGDTVVRVPVQGIGVGNAPFTFDSSSIDFGVREAGVAAQASLTLRGPQGSTARLRIVEATANGVFSVDPENPAGSTQGVLVKVRATPRLGTLDTAVLVVENELKVRVPLYVRGRPADSARPSFGRDEITMSPVDLGSKGTTSLRLANIGTLGALITLEVLGDPAFTVTPSQAEIGGLRDSAITVTFRPTRVGMHEARIVAAAAISGTRDTLFLRGLGAPAKRTKPWFRIRPVDLTVAPGDTASLRVRVDSSATENVEGRYVINATLILDTRLATPVDPARRGTVEESTQAIDLTFPWTSGQQDEFGITVLGLHAPVDTATIRLEAVEVRGPDSSGVVARDSVRVGSALLTVRGDAWAGLRRVDSLDPLAPAMALTPNVAIGAITVQHANALVEGGASTLRVIDANGVMVMDLSGELRAADGSFTLAFPLAQGRYWLELRTPRGLTVEELMVWAP